MLFIPPYRLIGTHSFPVHFHPDHVADLRASGLTDETIRAANVFSIRPCDIVRFFSRKGVPAEIETALCFPYQGATFARIKLFPALGKMKYAQPPKTSTRLYMPFPITSGGVYVCEGEKKTLAAYQAGLNAVGIGGVWSWLSNGQPIDDLNLIDWDSREVTIIPDSDVWQRVDLLRAIYALGCELRAQGASVYIARMPQPDGGKVGLDDFLVAGGKVNEIDVFSLSHSIFKAASFWHSKWKFTRAVRAAA